MADDVQLRLEHEFFAKVLDTAREGRFSNEFVGSVIRHWLRRFDGLVPCPEGEHHYDRVQNDWWLCRYCPAHLDGTPT